jgi:hypothetical protein
MRIYNLSMKKENRMWFENPRSCQRIPPAAGFRGKLLDILELNKRVTTKKRSIHWCVCEHFEEVHNAVIGC